MNPLKPVFILRWDEESRSWRSEFAAMAELPEEICRVGEGFGYGCLAVETNIGVVQVCDALASDIARAVQQRFGSPAADHRRREDLG